MARKLNLTQLLTAQFHPSILSVEDESHLHHVPLNSESHFKIIIISQDFKEMKLLQRHRKINQVVETEFKNGLHALSIHAYTEEEWNTKQIPPSPTCHDGFEL